MSIFGRSIMYVRGNCLILVILSIPAIVFAGTSGPPPTLLRNYPEFSMWVITLLTSGFITSTGIIGFFLHRTLKNIDEHNKSTDERFAKVMKYYGLLASRLAHLEGACESRHGKKIPVPVYPRREGDPLIRWMEPKEVLDQFDD